MHRPYALLALFALACRAAVPSGAAPTPAEHALAGLAAQHVAVLPTYAVRLVPGSTWGPAIGRPVDLERMQDADIASALDDRGLRKVWVFPDALVESYRRNSSYAADPYTLAEEPLRSPNLRVDARLPEPLASQIRTLVALHDDVRFVLAPVELRLEPVGTPPAQTGRGVLRLMLLDARLSNVQWIGDIVSDTVSSFGPVITASIAARLANVVASP
jgi:hypothetical protein